MNQTEEELGVIVGRFAFPFLVFVTVVTGILLMVNERQYWPGAVCLCVSLACVTYHAKK